MSKIKLEGIRKNYGPVDALKSINLDVKQGEFLTLLGPSGSGKTTLLNIIAGIVDPSGGCVSIGGKDVTRMPTSKRDIGMVFQRYALMPHMTIFENIAFPLRIRKTPEKELHQKVEQVLDLVKLSHVAKRRPKELSGGQQQRISLARCLVYNPSLILMDEPLGALDKKLREEMQIEIKQLHTQLDITVIYVTHAQDEALSMSDRIMLLNKGQVEQLGTPHELYFNPISIFSAEFVGDSNLIDGDVIAQEGKETEVQLITGDRISVGQKVDLKGEQSVKVLIRPENLSLREVDTTEEPVNNITGRIINSISLGGVMKHFISIQEGITVVVQELTDQAVPIPTPGETVKLHWRSSDCKILFS